MRMRLARWHIIGKEALIIICARNLSQGHLDLLEVVPHMGDAKEVFQNAANDSKIELLFDDSYEEPYQLATHDPSGRTTLSKRFTTCLA